jgi:D-alanyl-D-alanine carboxypeptidase/D-alanyl-D-alanine-endopeptidase (penicillin-binding protein 4)
MKKLYLILAMLVLSELLKGQELQLKLKEAMEKMQADSSLKHASVSFLVVDAKNGNTIFSSGENLALAPASTQKIFTSIAGYEILGKDFTYITNLEYAGQISNGTLKGNLILTGTGDPTLGSWRWDNTKDENVLKTFADALRKKGITRIEGGLLIESPAFRGASIPGGWIWDDIGNYYGAGASGFNWRENQYDLILQSGSSVGSAVKVISSKPSYVIKRRFNNELKAAAKGSGDNAYIYFPVGTGAPFILQGTIPAGENSFSISGASPDPSLDFIQEWKIYLGTTMKQVTVKNISGSRNAVTKWESPPYDSMNYWFMKKSINLYGEAFLKTMALQKKGVASVSDGVTQLQEFWRAAGVEDGALQVYDGSGLSPQNRVTTRALVTALQFARDRSWFVSFYHSLPVINHLRMKSGSISGARSYAGYHTRSDGTSLIFAIIVNNYIGNSSKVVRKMWDVLDELK